MTDNRICKLYSEKKMTCAEIARLDGRSESTIWKILNKNGLLRSRSEAIKIAPDLLFIQLYNLGLSQGQIAMLLDIHQSTVAKRLSACDFPSRPRDVAAKIAYTDEEFKRHFMKPSFRRRLKSLVE